MKMFFREPSQALFSLDDIHSHSFSYNLQVMTPQSRPSYQNFILSGQPSNPTVNEDIYLDDLLNISKSVYIILSLIHFPLLLFPSSWNNTTNHQARTYGSLIVIVQAILISPLIVIVQSHPHLSSSSWMFSYQILSSPLILYIKSWQTMAHKLFLQGKFYWNLYICRSHLYMSMDAFVLWQSWTVMTETTWPFTENVCWLL